MIVLDGLLNFTNNFAYIGSAFHVIGSSWFVLNESLKANFTGNSAMTSGGAIYAYNEQTKDCMFTTIMVQILLCFYSTITQLATLGVPFLVITSTVAQLEKITVFSRINAWTFISLQHACKRRLIEMGV